MSSTMGDIYYERKFNEMQRYIPFLERVIEKLKNNDHDKPRKAQLEKMQMLHNLLSNKQKKLKIETLLKCESVLKKLYAKIEKSDELNSPKKASTSTTTTVKNISSAAPRKGHPAQSNSAAPRAAKFVPKFNDSNEVNTCPASPTQFGDEDFRPPVEIPTERRCSPIRHWEQHSAGKPQQEPPKATPSGAPGRFQNRSSDHYRNSKYPQQQLPENSKTKHSRWSDWSSEGPSSMPSSNNSSSSHHRSWSSSSSSASSNTHRSHGQQKNAPKKDESSEEENWDEPDDERPKTKTRLTPPFPSQPQQSSHNKHKDPNNSHQHVRHHEKTTKFNRELPSHLPPSFPPLPDISLDEKKLFHDTIFKYKKPEPPANPYMNPPPPENSAPPTPPVKNDKMKPKAPKTTPPSLQVPPPVVPLPIDEVLKSPPLSADDIDDLLNESLEAAIGKVPKPKSNELTEDRKATALDLVRKKLAMISKPPPSGLESPPPASRDQIEKEPFYRRGQTPTKKPVDTTKLNPPPQSPQPEHAKPNVSPSQNPMDSVIERLALKYHPHRRRDSVSSMTPDHMKEKSDIASPPIRDNGADADRLAVKYNPHLQRDPMVSPLRTTDPRVSKSMGQISPLVSSPIGVSSMPNVLPTLNPYDPRLRNTRVTSVDPPFCTPILYSSPIPSLLKPSAAVASNKPAFGITPPSRIDPRTQKHLNTVYTEKFNPERNDQTERMKYLESKKKKPPEPKTYGEYKQSKCRQQAEEEAAKVEPVPSSLSTAPSTLDKMYRNADYSKELGSSIQGFKIPKKPKAEEPKIEPKKEDQESTKKPEEPAKKLEESVKKQEEPGKKQEESEKKQEEPEKSEKSVKKLDEPTKNADESKELKAVKIKTEVSEISQHALESSNDSKSADVLEEKEDENSPEPILTRGRRRGRPKNVKNECASPTEIKKQEEEEKEKEKEKQSEEEQEEEIKPRRIGTRRTTLLHDDDDNKRRSESPSPTLVRCRSASDLFGPTTDNSVVSTQNIITGKRKTRASMNFNEKATKKPATSKTPPAISPAPKAAGKSATKAVAAKKTTPVTTRALRRAGGKQTADDGQICAVSSTTSQGGDADDSHNDELQTEEVGTPEEPSSSASKRQTPAIDADENQKKQEWLEGFLKSIVDPTTNKDRILDMLKAVLDEKKLQQVKDILYSPDDEARDSPVLSKKQEQNKPRTRTKKNELDRLNEDIRDMFICQGVVTATGRRMCTLAKETAKEKPAAKAKESPKEKKTRMKNEVPPEPVRPASLPELPGKRRMRRAKVLISPLNIRALRSRSVKESRPPEMPVLEPNTPIKLPEEENPDSDEKTEVAAIPPKKKLGPKSKCPPSLDLGSDDDDDIQLVHLKKKIKGDDIINENENKVEEVAIVVDDVEENVEKKSETAEIEPVATKPTETLLVKNTNPDWHTMSDYASCCVICKEKARFIAPHYLNFHNDSEVYTSRLPPVVLEEIKRGIGNRALYSVPKKPNTTAYHYRCPFCDFQATNTLRGWMEHFTIHTGEYQYKCSKCFKAMNGCTHLLDHIKKFCPEAKRINREPVNLRGQQITGYVCHLCNFTQMLRNGVLRHLKTHHGLDDKETISQIIEVKLIDSADVPRMEEGADSKQTTDEAIAPPLRPASVTNGMDCSVGKESNMEVFLSRELVSPTSDDLTERLKSIDQDDTMTSDSSTKDGQSAVRMTIAEKLSQRFKNIEKQNLLDDSSSVHHREVNGKPQETEEVSKDNTSPPVCAPLVVSMEVEETPPAENAVPDRVPMSMTSPLSAVMGCASVDSSFNESGNLVIDEQEGDKSAADDDGSESERADENDEDDNENWEDIEITETKGTCQKDKNKNISIFQTLSRLYASIATKKGSKKPKEKEKKKTIQPLEKQAAEQLTGTALTSTPIVMSENAQASPARQPTPPSSVEQPAQSLHSAQVPQMQPSLQLLSSTQLAQTLQPALPPPQISNLSELLPDSPSDSLDMLLATNFNSLEGDGTSFPHLDLNDLDSPIFLLSEEQTNLQDAIAMAADMDEIKYDVLGDPLPLLPPQPQVSSSSVQRIGYIGFSLSGDSVKYYCTVRACTFLFSDHPDGLQNHFLLEHPTLRWDGFCHTCHSQVCPDGSREMQHMLDVHSKPPSIVQDASEKPRIKFRRLTGDILSTDKQRLPTPANLPPPVPSVLDAGKAPETQTPQLSLSTLLQSEPRAMIQPTPPPGFHAEIPLYKNVSKEFAIKSITEGVIDNHGHGNLVLTHAASTPGGMQISQVRSLNPGGVCLSPTREPLPVDESNIANFAFEHCNAPLLMDLHPDLQFPEILAQSNSSSPIQVNLPFTGSVPQVISGLTTATSQRNSPVPANPINPGNPTTQPVTFKCGAAICGFSTYVRSAMNEHLLFHLRTDNDKGSLKCHECAFVGRNITDYFQHMSTSHSISKSASPSLSTNELTQKIQDILRSTSNSSKSPELEEKELQPLENVPTKPKSFSEKLRAVAEEMVANTGIPELQVWKCPLEPECTVPVTERIFQNHVTRHISTPQLPRLDANSLQCPHCPVTYQRVAVLKAHMKTHARHRYFCHVCCATYNTVQQTQKHFNEAHVRTTHVQTTPLIVDEEPGTDTFFLVSLDKLFPVEVKQFGEKLLAEWERKKALTKTHFQPHEQDLLPLQPIFNNQVYCLVCNYKTKVRTNMYRHLQLHQQEVAVASVDPVNPVPCLEKNEKHFDKMLNLACSSNATGSGAKTKEPLKLPAYVPDLRRFVCGQPGCTYLTITENMLRAHLSALHSGEKGYQCPHCQEEICKKTLCVERIVQHLKLHSQKIYQCGGCDYYHYTKYVVERHIHDKHSPTQCVNLLMHERTDGEGSKITQTMMGRSSTSNQPTATEGEFVTPSTPAASPATPASKFKWECALCKHQTMTWNQMISHANSMHRAKHQYQCVHCVFGSAHLANIMEHIDTKHPTKTREAKYVFYKINETPQDKAADTRPLWSRDDPKRVRSIRGILMENEEDAERTKQSLSNAGVDLDDEDEDVEIVQVIESDVADKPEVLGCFHCDFKSESMDALSFHWKTKHWHTHNNEMVPMVPFFFRIHSILKCPSCSFVGDHVLLQLHAYNKHGQRTFTAVDPKLPFTCGHCPYAYPPKRIDFLARHYNREHRPTDVKNLSSNLLKSILALGECQVYMQCYFCAEICADKTAIIEHERQRHGSSNVRYKQIKDEVIYRCGMCQYSSTNELATLRHMVDHFGGFKNCHFCMQPQNNFKSYMEHCYISHPNELKNFKTIYPLQEVKAFLGQMLIIFPNGLIVNKRNLSHTQYGSLGKICAMYDEICKKALEPPIPPLYMAQLIAKRTLEASESSPSPAPLLPPPPIPVAAKRIAKRRSTVAMGVGDRGALSFAAGQSKVKKRKASIEDRAVPTVPLFSTITAPVDGDVGSEVVACDAPPTEDEPLGVSFYGKKPEKLDLSKIYTQIAIGDKYAPVSVKKFALLFKINAKVVVDKMDFKKHQLRKRNRTASKPCPASKKKKYI